MNRSECIHLDFTPNGSHSDIPRLNQADISRQLLGSYSSRWSELLNIVMCIYVADRLCSRNHRGVTTGQRTFQIKIPVTDSLHWHRSDIQLVLSELVGWTTGDLWDFTFIDVPPSSPMRESAFPFGPLHDSNASSAALYSGGLDSLAGLCMQLEASPETGPVLVSGFTTDYLLSLQRRQLDGIKDAVGRKLDRPRPNIVHLPFSFGMKNATQREKSQRSRALVFLTFGATVAASLGMQKLEVYENGIGALNLPLNATQLGVDNYRGVHPHTLLLFERLLKVALDVDLQIENPCLFMTKGDMCKSIASIKAGDSVGDTVTCDSFPLRLPNGVTHCGHCPSCILRRLSLRASGLAPFDNHAKYQHDIFGEYQRLGQRAKFDICLVRDQAWTFTKIVHDEHPGVAACLQFPDLNMTLTELPTRLGESQSDITEHLVNLLSTYVAECEQYLPVIHRTLGVHP